MDFNWDDEDVVLPSASSATAAAADDDLFEFSTSLRLSDDEGAPPPDDLPPLAKGVEDLTGDRGVLVKRLKAGDTGDNCPSKEEPYIEMHFEGFLVATGDKFDSSRDQNYAMIVQLDIPASGKSSVIRGLEAALQQLRKGDVVSLTLASRYAYGKDGAPDIPPDSDLRFEIEVLDVRATHKRVITVDSTQTDMDRLEEIRRDREVAQQRREEERAVKEQEKTSKTDRAAALREKLANKNKGGKKGGKKKK